MVNGESNRAESIGYQPGEEIGRFEVISRIAIGGQSIIYKCHDPVLDRFVAVKQISTHLAEDQMFLDRFRGEAQILARLGAEQAEIVTIHDLLESKQGLFIVMEYVQGVSLERTLADNPGPVELKATLQILWKLCSALHAVHLAGIIHRDIKPSNILIADGLRPMISDFGVAATASGQTSMVLGTTKYMAPELFTGEYVDGRADMYSLGFIAYEMLVGREKFNEIFADITRDRHAESLRWMKWHSNPKVSAPPPNEVNPAVPVTLSNIVLRMIAKDSEQRFEGMEALGRAIKQTFKPGAKPVAPPRVPVAQPIGEEATSVMPDRVPDESPFDAEEALTAPIPKRKLSTGAVIGLIAAAMVVLAVGAGVMLYLRGQEEVQDKDAAKNAYKAAQDLYRKATDFAKAEKGFLEVRRKYPGTIYFDPSEVYVHVCRARLAVKDRDWSRAQTEQDTADDLVRSLQKKSEKDSPLYKWTQKMKGSIREFDNYRISRKQFDEVMARARGLADGGKGEEAVSLLDDEYQDPTELDAASQKEILDLREKIARRQSLDVVEKDLAAARKADTSDVGAAIAAYDKAKATLQRHKDNIDPIKYAKMVSEIRKAHGTLVKDKSLSDVMTSVDNARKEARETKDTTRLLAALKRAMLKPGVPKKVVDGWAAEIKQTEKEQDRAKYMKLLAAGRTDEAYDEVVAFLNKYPGDRNAGNLKVGLEKRKAKAVARTEAFRLYDLQRWAEALEKLRVVHKQARGDREVRDKIKRCQYELEMITFRAAVKKFRTSFKNEDYKAAVAAGERARMYNPDAFETRIEPVLVEMQAQMKVAATLKQGQTALASRQYRKVREILDPLKDSNPEAATMIRQSRYRENVAKGKASLSDNDVTTALATFKMAKKYAKDPKEQQEINALIAAAEKVLNGE